MLRTILLWIHASWPWRSRCTFGVPATNRKRAARRSRPSKPSLLDILTSRSSMFYTLRGCSTSRGANKPYLWKMGYHLEWGHWTLQWLLLQTFVQIVPQFISLLLRLQGLRGNSDPIPLLIYLYLDRCWKLGRGLTSSILHYVNMLNLGRLVGCQWFLCIHVRNNLPFLWFSF